MPQVPLPNLKIYYLVAVIVWQVVTVYCLKTDLFKSVNFKLILMKLLNE